MQEIWLPVIGYEGAYEVSNLGRIRSINRVINYPESIRHSHGHRYKISAFSKQSIGQILKQSMAGCGYIAVCLRSGYSGGKTLNVHRLVALAFLPNPNALNQVNHIDGCKTNNQLVNLEWCSASQNIQHAHATGLSVARKGEQVINSKLKTNDIFNIRKLLNDGVVQSKIAYMYGVAPKTISDIKTRRNWAHI